MEKVYIVSRTSDSWGGDLFVFSTREKALDHLASHGVNLDYFRIFNSPESELTKEEKELREEVLCHDPGCYPEDDWDQYMRASTHVIIEKEVK